MRWAATQYGHSKSPYMTSSSGPSPRTWSPAATGVLRSIWSEHMDDLEFLLLLLAAAAVLVRLADLIRVPYPIVLVLGGLLIGFIPGLPDLELQPDVVFL